MLFSLLPSRAFLPPKGKPAVSASEGAHGCQRLLSQAVPGMGGFQTRLPKEGNRSSARGWMGGLAFLLFQRGLILQKGVQPLPQATTGLKKYLFGILNSSSLRQNLSEEEGTFWLVTCGVSREHFYMQYQNCPGGSVEVSYLVRVKTVNRGRRLDRCLRCHSLNPKGRSVARC